jgi:predicted DNA repair protein MutK
VVSLSDGWSDFLQPSPSSNNLCVRDVSQIVFTEGVRAGLALSACVVVLAILGLTPSMSWIPEVPLLGVAILLPLAGYGLTGYRVGKRSGRTLAGAMAGGVAGVVSGGVGGVAYVIFGKSVLNVVVGLLLGAVGGAIVGAAAARLSRRTSRLEQVVETPTSEGLDSSGRVG